MRQTRPHAAKFAGRPLTNGSPHRERRRSTSGERVRSSAVNKKQRALEVCEPEHRGGGEAVPFREAQVGGVGSSPLPSEIRVGVGGATTLQNCVTLQAANSNVQLKYPPMRLVAACRKDNDT